MDGPWAAAVEGGLIRACSQPSRSASWGSRGSWRECGAGREQGCILFLLWLNLWTLTRQDWAPSCCWTCQPP